MTTKSFFHRNVLKLKQLLCGSMGSIIIMQRFPPHTHTKSLLPSIREVEVPCCLRCSLQALI